MDIFDDRNYRLNRSFLYIFGQWPLQTAKERYLLRTASALIIASIIVPKIIKFSESMGDMTGMIECLPMLGIHFRSLSKFINCIINARKMETLIVHIKKSWNVRTADFERVILNRYAERGRMLTILYAAYLGSAMLTFLFMPFVPIIMDVILPLNETRERVYPYETEYYDDNNEHYFYIVAHAWFAMPFALGMIVAYDTMFAVNVYHVCSIFAMLGVRLERIGKEMKNNKSATEECREGNKDQTYEDIVACIKIHKEAADIAQLLESSGYMCYLFVIGVSMLATTLTGFMTVKSLDHPGDALRYGSFAVGEVIHLFYFCWQGHTLVEHCEHIFICAYNVDWYDISPRAKKLLILIMIRSAEPCKLTAGKVYAFSMENFAAALKTSMSYFTVLLSMQ